MTREQFWALIAIGETQDEPGPLVRAALAKLSPSELVSYEEHFSELFEQAYRWDLWAAAYVLDGGCSDDGFTDFRYALISRGRRIYEAALADPDSLATADVWADELFGYIAGDVYEAKTGHEIPRRERQGYGPGEPQGESWDFDDLSEVRRRLPKIAARVSAR